MRVFSNCARAALILMPLYLLSIFNICFAHTPLTLTTQVGLIESSEKSFVNEEKPLENSLRNHSFIAESSEPVDNLVNFDLPGNFLEELLSPQFAFSSLSDLDIPSSHFLKNVRLDSEYSLKADFELMRSGRREYFPKTFSRNWSMLKFIVHSFLIEQTMVRASASLWFSKYLEASGSMWAEGIGRTTRVDLKVTIRNLPLFKQARLVSRYFQISSPRGMWHEPWLERGYKFNVGDISLSEGRFVSNLELQFPDILGGRGIVGALSLNADNGLGFGINVDLPNLQIPGTRFKLKLPDIRFVLFH